MKTYRHSKLSRLILDAKRFADRMEGVAKLIGIHQHSRKSAEMVFEALKPLRALEASICLAEAHYIAEQAESEIATIMDVKSPSQSRTDEVMRLGDFEYRFFIMDGGRRVLFRRLAGSDKRWTGMSRVVFEDYIEGDVCELKTGLLTIKVNNDDFVMSVWRAPA